MEPLITGVLIAACYDVIKSGSFRGIKKVSSKDPKKLEDVFDDTITDISREYNIVERDFRLFFHDSNVERMFKQYVERDESPDFRELSEILDDYIIKDEMTCSQHILEDFLKRMEDNLISIPKLKDELYLKYLKSLKQGNSQLSNQIEANTESIAKIKEMFTRPNIFGKIFRPNDFPNNIDFLKEVSKSLNEDKYYTHEITLIDGNVKYALKPKSEDAEKLDPIRMKFTIILEKKDGKVVTLEDMLEKAREKGEPLIIEADSIKEFIIYKGDKPLQPNSTKPGRLELRPLPLFPTRSVNISIPGTPLSYDNIVLQVEERSESLLVISNQKQDFPIKFRFKFLLGIENTSKTEGQYDINAIIEEMDVKEVYEFSNFIRRLKDSNTLTIEDSQTNKNICTCHNINVPDVYDSDECFNLMEKLVFIQDITGIRIPLPLAINAQDLISIEIVYTYLKYGKTEVNSNEYNLALDFGKEKATEVLEIINGNNFIDDLFTIQDGFEINICGVHISLGNVELHFPRMKTKKPLDELKKELEECLEDTFRIDFIPYEKVSTLLVLPKRRLM